MLRSSETSGFAHGFIGETKANADVFEERFHSPDALFKIHERSLDDKRRSILPGVRHGGGVTDILLADKDKTSKLLKDLNS